MFRFLLRPSDAAHSIQHNTLPRLPSSALPAASPLVIGPPQFVRLLKRFQRGRKQRTAKAKRARGGEGAGRAGAKGQEEQEEVEKVEEEAGIK